MKIALTGHRKERLRGNEDVVEKWLHNILNFLFMEQEEQIMICGGAEGADEIFGSLIWWFPTAELHLCLPVKGYREKKMHPYIKKMKNEEHVMAEEWRPGLDTVRDRYMVNNCDVLIAVWDGIEKGGVWETIEYARAIGKPIIYFPHEVLVYGVGKE